jgi:tellurite resistance-related uncharacterized protein
MSGWAGSPFGVVASGAAQAEFVRAMRRVAIAAVLLAAVAIWYVSLFGTLSVHMVIATVLGVFFSILLGCGLFAAAFFSANSGHDQIVTDATRSLPRHPTELPDGLTPYRRTAIFTETSVPAALLGDHDTKPGCWGLIQVSEGQLRYRVTDPRRAPYEAVLTPGDPPGIVEPTMLHHVAPIGAVRFQVEFWREGGRVLPLSG